MGVNQRISTTVPGPIFSKGGFISVTASGTIDGGRTGVNALTFSITTLSNRGAILGGTLTKTGAGTLLLANAANTFTAASVTGGTVTLKDVRITMVPAVHTSSVTVGSTQRALGVVIGYVFRFANGFTIYNTGDTAATMDMKIVHDLYKPDLVILPIGDFYTMGPDDALRAVTRLEPKRVMPIHYDTFPAIKQDAHAWAARVRESTDAEPYVLEPGGWLDLG